MNYVAHLKENIYIYITEKDLYFIFSLLCQVNQTFFSQPPFWLSSPAFAIQSLIYILCQNFYFHNAPIENS